MTVSLAPDTLGLLAGTLTTLAFLPQLVKTWRSRSAEDVSIGMFLMFCAGVVLWGVYGWEIHAFPVIVTNVITFLLAAAILILKLFYERRSRDATEENADSTSAIEPDAISVVTVPEARETTRV
ncbi:MAG: SemiSWEET transporter [Cyanobacteria bacterium J06648_11]